MKRVLLVKGGMDGHDRGILIVAQALRNAGVEVIYGGLYQSPPEIVAQALEEDVDMIGISMHSHAHLGVFPEVLQLLKKEADEDWFVFGGGVIPKKDISLLEEIGVKKVFLPGTNTKDITDFVLGVQVPAKGWSDLIKRVKKGEALAASRLMTLIQRGDKEGKKAVSKLSSSKQDTSLVGITGPGGVGKSTLINKLICSFRAENKTVGVVTCDPVSVSGGAFLGDRIRMREHTLDNNVFIRSLAQSKNFKGVTPETPHIMKIFEALKKEVVIVETVGAGQEDLGFRDLVDILVLVLMPGLGDEIQMLKGGVIETADIIVINQSDRPGAETMLQNLLMYFGDTKGIYKTNAITGEGIPELMEGIKEHK